MCMFTQLGDNGEYYALVWKVINSHVREESQGTVLINDLLILLHAHQNMLMTPNFGFFHEKL